MSSKMTKRILIGLAVTGFALATAACDPVGGNDQAAEQQVPSTPALGLAPAPAPAPARSKVMHDGFRGAPLAVVAQEQYPGFRPNPEQTVTQNPVTTISLDVDTAAYSRARRFLTDGQKPPAHAIRIEEMVNYFDYAYPKPQSAAQPFLIDAEITANPWRPDRKLLRVGIQAYKIPGTERPPVNLVYLVDVSGSMRGADRLGLVKLGLTAMTEKLGPSDHVSIVTYAGQAGIALEPRNGADKAPILAAIRSLGAGGGTAGAAGLNIAYDLATANFDKDAVNRIVLLTDGDFNIGPSDPTRLADMIAEKRKTGVYLSVFTVGKGNLNDRIAQTLAQKGNGNAGYLDGPLEAQRAMADDMNAAALPVADDVKAQIEFNPNRVAAYKLIGYETRALANRDFADDGVDAAEVGSGQSVTLLYEIRLRGDGDEPTDLRYQNDAASPKDQGRMADEWGFVQLRYKQPGAETSTLFTRTITDADVAETLEATTPETRFAMAVAAFGLRLRDAESTGDFDFMAIGNLANPARGADPDGRRGEFVRLTRTAATLETNAWGQ